MAFNVAETDLAGQIRALLFVEPAAEIFYECLRIAFAKALHHVIAEREIVEAVADGTEDVGASFGKRGGGGIEFARAVADGLLHINAAWRKRLAGTGVGDIWIPVRNLAAAAGVDAVSIDAIRFDVMARDVFHVVDPAWPVEVEAPIM